MNESINQSITIESEFKSTGSLVLAESCHPSPPQLTQVFSFSASDHNLEVGAPGGWNSSCDSANHIMELCDFSSASACGLKEKRVSCQARFEGLRLLMHIWSWEFDSLSPSVSLTALTSCIHSQHQCYKIPRFSTNVPSNTQQVTKLLTSL